MKVANLERAHICPRAGSQTILQITRFRRGAKNIDIPHLKKLQIVNWAIKIFEPPLHRIIEYIYVL